MKKTSFSCWCEVVAMVAILNLGLALNFYASFPYIGAKLASVSFKICSTT